MGFEEILSKLPEDKKKKYLQRLKLCPFLSYKPHSIQDAFHKDPSRFRLILAGNRFGKTYAGAMEAIWMATGTHPYKKVEVPNQGWVVSLDFPTSRDVTQPIIKQLLGQGYLKDWREADKIAMLVNGSEIAFKSVDSGWDKFQGTKKLWIWFDEEPKNDVYQECRMRVTDLKGYIWITETPMQGMSWVYDDIYVPWEQDRGDWIVFTGKTSENPYLDMDEVKALSRVYVGEERDARLEGKFVLFAGMVYKEFDYNVHVKEPFDIPKGWTRIRAIDPGINNPTCCLWMAIDPDDNYYIYDEYYEPERTVQENASVIKAMSGQDDISYTMIDPVFEKRDIQDLTSVKDEYARCGIPTLPGLKDVSMGISSVKRKLHVGEKINKPQLYFLKNCRNTLKEIVRYRWDEFRINPAEKNRKEKPKKLQDHAMDCLRWLCANEPRYVNPELTYSIMQDTFKPTVS